MSKTIQFSTKETGDLVLIEFTVPSDFSYEALNSLMPPDPVSLRFAHKGVVLSGRGPVWLFGFLVHFYHPTKFVATFDPRLKGAVVVESHGSKWKPGDLIPSESFNF